MAVEDHTKVRPWRAIDRRVSRKIRVGSVEVGGDAPISVQSMTNTPTSDARATINQIRGLEEAGADIVRVSCPDEDSTAAFRTIAREAKVPLVADIHFHYKRGIEAAEAGAACLRINPGNIGSMARVKDVVSAARNNGCSIRIGVNAGSLERELLEKYGEPCPDAMVESALNHARILDDLGFHEYKISVKASDLFLTVAAYQMLAEATDAPLHLGVTEAGGLRSGTIKSAIGMGSLLWAGIGDTIRVSLSAEPVEEIRAGFDMLKALGLRTRGVNIIACPSCARQGFDVIRTVEALEARLAHISEPISLSIIGCVVNGPGEAAYTDLGFTGGGKGAGMLYFAGQQTEKVSNETMIERIVAAVEDKAAKMRAAREALAAAE
ncbi:flavodoxin-dependent (E)-4-hydroxy-3-methylbut-2-enyl-diphosphate synthase [Glycocaulis sp.]|uniref:flavodoxin-dependent (E)-4-hydroxy-3-methylbut-2-enyl-diphosphate synthase n=1 Tax=Glycocaulis sp. TaxID=1969725 RepID=UPI003F6EDE44